MPDELPIVAVVVGVIVQVPPDARSAKSVVAPTHTCNVPPIEDGPVLTFTVVVAEQPEPDV